MFTCLNCSTAGRHACGATGIKVNKRHTGTKEYRILIKMYIWRVRPAHIVQTALLLPLHQNSKFSSFRSDVTLMLNGYKCRIRL